MITIFLQYKMASQNERRFSYRNVGGLLWEAEAAEKLLHSEGVVPVVGRAGEERFDLVLRKKNATVVSFP